MNSETIKQLKELRAICGPDADNWVGDDFHGDLLKDFLAYGVAGLNALPALLAAAESAERMEMALRNLLSHLPTREDALNTAALNEGMCSSFETASMQARDALAALLPGGGESARVGETIFNKQPFERTP